MATKTNKKKTEKIEAGQKIKLLTIKKADNGTSVSTVCLLLPLVVKVLVAICRDSYKMHL